MTRTIIIQLIPSGDLFAAHIRNGHMTDLSSPLHHRDIPVCLGGDWDADPEAIDDVERLNAHPDTWQDVTRRYQ